MIRLWHLDLSHYNEKARWALDLKRVPHVRRRVPPGVHLVVAKILSGGSTLPVLEVDGQHFGDSTDILAEIERRFPEPPLYPADPVQRARALELEELFDEGLGPSLRSVALERAMGDPKVALLAADPYAGVVRRAMLRPAVPGVVAMLRGRYAADPGGAERGLAETRAMLDRIVAEVGPSGYLAGDGFSVADLTAASLCLPLSARPYAPEAVLVSEELAELRDELRRHPAMAWVDEMYDKHRGATRR